MAGVDNSNSTIRNQADQRKRKPSQNLDGPENETEMKSKNKRVKNDDPNNSDSAVLYAINTLTEKVNSVFDSLSSRMDNLERKFEDGLTKKIADAVRKVVHEEFGKEISNFKKEINQDIGNIKSDLDKLSKSYVEVAKPAENNKKYNIVIKKT
ncbi:unnamed protein product [Mytilus coruscus]|uniref:Uncharacterized protein n=1 Tax=Mytilus coruscus TaxID=42192 RepID=A0A6J8E7C5_MYTCO|nr:unnamed protein product [Mytilus coruscus]